MPHDWGVTVPKALPTEDVMEILGKLRAGTISFGLPESLKTHEKYAEWMEELSSQTLAAYEKEAARRRC